MAIGDLILAFSCAVLELEVPMVSFHLYFIHVI